MCNFNEIYVNSFIMWVEKKTVDIFTTTDLHDSIYLYDLFSWAYMPSKLEDM